MRRLSRRAVDIALVMITIASAAAIVLAHEDPFAREALCKSTGACPTSPDAKAWNKIFYDLAIGALVSVFFYYLVVRLPDFQKRQRLKSLLEKQYAAFREDSIATMLMVADGTFLWGFQREISSQEKFREYFSQAISVDQDRWHAFLNNIDAHHLDQLKKYLEIFRDEIIFILNNVDIPGDEPFEFLKRLSRAIYSVQDATTGYDEIKSIERFLWSVFAGWDVIDGYRKDDLVKKMIDAI